MVTIRQLSILSQLLLTLLLFPPLSYFILNLSILSQLLPRDVPTAEPSAYHVLSILSQLLLARSPLLQSGVAEELSILSQLLPEERGRRG